MQDNRLHDINTAADIDHLVEVFYTRVLTDPIIGFFFTDIAKIELEKHLPVISAFWQLHLLGKPGYRGQTFAKHTEVHRRAALTADHFHRWLYLFETAIDQLFAGQRADAAKKRARQIARSMQRALAERHTIAPELHELGKVGHIRPTRRKHTAE